MVGLLTTIKTGKSSKVKVSPINQRAQEAWDLDQNSDEDDSLKN